MPSWACCGENRVFSFRRGCGFKYTILEGMALSFCQSVNASSFSLPYFHGVALVSDFTRFSWNRGLPFCHLYAFDSFFVFCRCACCTLIGSCRVIFLSFSVANGLGITVCILPSNNYKNHPLGGTRAVLLPSFLRLERFAVQMCGELFFVWLRLIFCSA